MENNWNPSKILSGNSKLIKLPLKELNTAQDIVLHTVFKYLPVNFYLLDNNGIVLGCNESESKLLGFCLPNEILGKHAIQISSKKSWENSQKVMKSNTPEILEEEHISEGGEKRTYISVKNPLPDESGKIVGLIGVSIDITERKKAEEELKIAKEKAEMANKTKTAFLENMRHDLKTPFSGILGIAECLEMNEADPKKKELLSYITQSARVLLNHINEILDYVRTANGEVRHVSKQFDLPQLLRDTFNMVLPAAKQKKLEFILNMDKNVPQYVIGDDIRTQRILINLLSNAFKFTEKGFVKLGTQIAQQTEKQVILKLSVEDSGIGIPTDKQESIFEHFSRLHPSCQGVYSGIGLGLRMVKQFLEELRGEVHVQSTVGQGTLLKLLIPYQLP